MTVDNGPIRKLPPSEAWALLEGNAVGRLAVSVGGQPDIFPVNFAAENGSIVFRTAPGSKLLEVTINAKVAFETDNYDAEEAWSVVVKGTASALEEQSEIFEAEKLELRPWIPTVKPVFVRIVPSEVTGRWFQIGPEPAPDPY